MNKIHLESIVEKYYLNGLVERTRLTISNNAVEIKFINDNKNLTGKIIAGEFEFKDSEIGIYDTTQFLKLVSILNQYIIIKPDEKNGVIQNLSSITLMITHVRMLV